MRKVIVLLVLIISLLMVGCSSQIETEKSASLPKLKPLELTGPATPGQIDQVILKTELPVVADKLEVFEPFNIRKAEKTFWDSSKAAANASESSVQPTSENSMQIAKDFFKENGIDLSQGSLTSDISASTTFTGGKRIIERVTVRLERNINDIPLVDDATEIYIGLDNQMVGYSRNEFDLKSIGKYPIISPQKALNLIPKYQNHISGVTFGKTGYVTEVRIGYWGFRQKNIQPVYIITGFTDENKKEDTFNLMIPAIKFNN